jgi:hypothetical protein
LCLAAPGERNKVKNQIKNALFYRYLLQISNNFAPVKDQNNTKRQPEPRYLATKTPLLPLI